MKTAGSKTKKAAKPAKTKKEIILALMRRKHGVTVADLVTATGWLPKTISAFVTKEKQRHGLVITAGPNPSGVHVYRIAK